MTTMTQLPPPEEIAQPSTDGNTKEKGSSQTVKDRILDTPWAQEVKKVLLAGVGAVVLAQEEIEGFVKRLVAKGEIGVKEAKRIVEETLKRRREEAKRGLAQIEKTLDVRIEQVLSRMNVATKKDIQALQETLKALLEKVTRSGGRGPSDGGAPPPPDEVGGSGGRRGGPSDGGAPPPPDEVEKLSGGPA